MKLIITKSIILGKRIEFQGTIEELQEVIKDIGFLN